MRSSSRPSVNRRRDRDAPAGEHGFGYDPIFFYPPLGKTTGELTLAEKSAVSHRARAFRDFARLENELHRRK